MPAPHYRLYHVDYFQINLNMYAAMDTKAINPHLGSFADITFSLFDTTFDYHAQWMVYLDQTTRSLAITWIPNDLPEGSNPQITADASTGKLTSDGQWIETQNWSSSDHYTDTGYEGTLWQYHDDDVLPDSIIIAGRIRYALPTVHQDPILFFIDMPASYYLQSL